METPKEIKYWHEASDEDIKLFIDQSKTWGWVMQNYRQPDWCVSPGALEGMFGCWSLTSLTKRKLISKDFCSDCPHFKSL